MPEDALSRRRKGSETWVGASGPGRSGVGKREAHPQPLPPAGGEPRLSASALSLCGLAARALGWRPHEFWAATPAELAACLADPGAPTAPLGRGDLELMMKGDPDGRLDRRR